MQKNTSDSTTIESPSEALRTAEPAQASRMKSSVPYRGDEPAMELAHSGGFFGLNAIKPSEVRHVLITGETGSGKTWGCLVPWLIGGLTYKCPSSQGLLQAAAVVIDPKRELLPVVETTLAALGESDRLVVLGRGQTIPRVRFFDRSSGVAEAEQLSRLDVVSDAAETKEGQHVYWHRVGRLMLSSALALEQAYLKEQKGRPLFEQLADTFCPHTTRVGGFWGQVHALFTYLAQGEEQVKRVHIELQKLLVDAHLDNLPDANFLNPYHQSSDHHIQFIYRFQTASTLLDALRHPAVAEVIDFDPFPAEEEPGFDVRKAIDDGAVIVVQPDATVEGDQLARAIKAKVYEAVLTRSQMERPVMIYIDEFQRVITDDKLSGEARFLDVARSYRASCFLATQSIDALHFTLGSTNNAAAAVSTIITNTTTKFFFNTKDERTTQVVKNLTPKSAAGPHVVDCRPLGGLPVGEAYWFLGNARGLDKADLSLLKRVA